MKFIPAIVFTPLIILVSYAVFAQEILRDQKSQELSREQKLSQIKDLEAQIAKVTESLLLAPPSDFSAAESDGLQVFRLNPREVYGRITVPQGGGCYYSFSEKSHDYQRTAQIELQQGYLSVGFAGADYGFMIDLGDRSLGEIGVESLEAKFLLDYIAPSDEPVARAEYRKLQGYDAEGFVYKNRFPAVVGHSYLLRAITFSRSDVLVGFRVMRRDTDGSLIIYWKPLKTFDKPELKRQDVPKG